MAQRRIDDYFTRAEESSVYDPEHGHFVSEDELVSQHAILHDAEAGFLEELPATNSSLSSPMPRLVRLKNQSTTDHKASPSALSIINENTT